MTGYKYQSGVVTVNGVVTNDTIDVDLDGFDTVDINVTITTLNANHMNVQVISGIDASGVTLGQSPRLYQGSGVTFSIKGASSGVRLQFFISGGAATANITYRIVARG